ncbi:LOW QUALITY PROTEIN: enoyl-CoA hydratase [Geosmithia morbida]|uniref:Enoyl-CoA hydratase n=1 Tax=Geosmithia morbida TaxID=1094350 RepID=A0A9P4YN24_9HYPO|nr:LOW QUALITY PROTEIN: enoyl-CoA hydratase [Geosmithia morbida]KAF4119472.1 LOW QUALITY PROTEIN: enoyl-CoA hydratase [Geosmithia morbida]
MTTHMLSGGGMESVLNADVIFDSPYATFRLTEVLCGVSLAGAPPQAIVLFGNSKKLFSFNARILATKKAVPRTLGYDEISSVSPNSVIISRLAAWEAWETAMNRLTMRDQEL